MSLARTFFLFWFVRREYIFFYQAAEPRVVNARAFIQPVQKTNTTYPFLWHRQSSFDIFSGSWSSFPDYASAFYAYFDASYPVDISVKRQGNSKAKAGGTTTLTFTVTNVGDAPINGVDLMVTAPGDMSLIKASHPATKGGDKAGPIRTRNCDTTSWALPVNLAPGKSGAYKLTFRIDACATAGSYEVVAAVGATQAPGVTMEVTRNAWANKKCKTVD